MRGPKPSPFALKRFAKPGERADNTLAGIPECPDHLSDDAKTEWARVSAELHTLGLIALVDRAALSAYCQAWSRRVDAERHLAAEGLVISAPSGYPVQSPWIAIANKAIEQIRVFGAEFGLTPSSRTRLKINDKPKTVNRFSELARVAGGE